MVRKKIALSIILLCIGLLSSCFQSTKYPKYELEKQDNGQYILTSPDGISYATFENTTWFPEKILTGYDYNEAIGRCDFGYIFDTDSEICIFTDNLKGSKRYTFFLADTILPELSIENINNAVLKSTGDRDSQIIVDKQSAKELIELYNNTEAHEIKRIHSTLRTWELVMECEQFRGLYFSRPIYAFGTEYYLYITYEYDSNSGKTTYILCKCTSVIKNILENN